MSRVIPYLKRRGNVFSFRIAVPSDLRNIIQLREFTKSLDTGDFALAVSRCLILAAQAKHAFYTLRKMKKEKKTDGGEFRIDYTVEINFDEFSRKKNLIVNAEPHEEEAATATAIALIQAANEMGLGKPLSAPAPSAEIMLYFVTTKFLEAYPSDKPEMLKKHNSCIPAFCEVIGDMPIKDLKRSHVKAFFDLLQKLPPRWSDIKRKNSLTILQVANQKHAQLIGEKTFTYTYKTSINQFLTWSKENFGEQGFPDITIATIRYEGDRKAGENKQRPFNRSELKRLFEGQELAAFAADPDQEHCYWLPMLGLFTGARVNELCQLNPQHDILEESHTGIWYLWITEETDSDILVKKSVKNSPSKRKVPIHSKLIEMGILGYVSKIKSSGERLLFPKWKPSKGKASAAAEKWFRGLLIKCNLRDKSLGANLVGMHAFRHTFSSTALNLGVDESAIVGHSNGASQVANGYRGELSLTNKQMLIEKIVFDLNFPKLDRL
jgi:integrase